MKREDERARPPPEGDTDLGQTHVQMTGLSAFERNPFGRERIFQSVKRRGEGRGFQSRGKQERILALKFAELVVDKARPPRIWRPTGGGVARRPGRRAGGQLRKQILSRVSGKEDLKDWEPR